MVTIRIKENSKMAKAVIAMLREFSFVEFEKERKFNAETERAMKDARDGKGLIKAKNVSDLMKKLND